MDEEKARAGKLGGDATKANHDPDYYKRIGYLRGKLRKGAKHSSETKEKMSRAKRENRAVKDDLERLQNLDDDAIEGFLRDLDSEDMF